jgi:Flp pilus assembly protein TadG
MPFPTKSFTVNFTRDERGTVAVLFGLMAMVLLLVSGIAVDQARLYQSSSKLSAAADAAALAAGRALLDGQLSDAEVEALGERFFYENMKSSGEMVDVKSVRIIPNRAENSVRVDIDAEVPMTLTRVAGYQTAATPAKSITNFDRRDIELGLALDVTGSMSGTKIEDLKLAAADLVNILLPDTPTSNKVRIGLAPYAAGINAGSYASTVTNGASSRCVHERDGAQAFTDAAPGLGTWLGTAAGMNCPTAEIQPLSDNKDALHLNIEAYTAGGTTAGHLGAEWAWYLVSPEWASIWPEDSRPVDYDDANTIKAIVLMTDGKFNTHYISGNGNSTAQALNACDEMKDKGVIVYSVAFQAPASAEATLRDCATSNDTYFNASNGEELRLAFKSVAADLNNLRLTQ